MESEYWACVRLVSRRCNFPETLQYLPEEKAVLTGSPIRAELLKGNGIRILGLRKASISQMELAPALDITRSAMANRWSICSLKYFLILEIRILQVALLIFKL